MGKIDSNLSPCREKVTEGTSIVSRKLPILWIILLIICVHFPLVSFCKERADNCYGMNEKYILSEPNKIIAPESVSVLRPQKQFIGSPVYGKYIGNVQDVGDKDENGASATTIIKAMPFMLTFLVGSFTAFSIVIGFTSWKVQSSYKEEVARAKEAADKAERITEGIEEKGREVVKKFEEQAKEISKGVKSEFEAFAKFVSITTMLEDYLSKGKELAGVLSITKDYSKVTPDERDFLTLTLVHLKKLPEKLTVDERIRYKGTFDKLLKDARDIKACLKRVPYKGAVQDLTDICDEIIKILETLTAKPEHST